MKRSCINFSFTGIFFLLFLGCPVQTLYGQLPELQFKHYSYPEGLAAPVRRIIQDKTGFIWLGTTDGLYRFDGKNFTVFRNSPGDTNSLCNNIINCLSLDPEGDIWVGTNGGLCYFSNRDYRFHQMDLADTLEPGDRYRIHALNAGGQNEVWFGTKSRVHQLQRQNGLIRSFNLPQITNRNVRELYITSAGKIWIGTNENGLYILDPMSRQLIAGSITSAYAQQQNLSITIHPIVHYSGDTLLMGSWYGGLQKIYSVGSMIQNQELSNRITPDHKKHIVTGISRWHSNLWWIGTYGSGLSVFDGQKNEFIHTYRFNRTEPNSLGSDYINDVLVDRGGILWVGTESGLDKYDEKSNQFKLIRIPGRSNETSVVRLPTAFLEDKDNPHNLLMTVPGIGLLQYYSRTSLIRPLPLTGDGSFNEKNINTVYRDTDDVIWLGTRNGLYGLPPNSNEVFSIKFKDGLSPRGVHNIMKDHTGALWFATYSNGVYSLDRSGQNLVHYAHYPGEPNMLPDNRIFCQLEDHNGDIWIGSQNRGLSQIHPGSGKITNFEHRKGDPASIPDNNIYALYEDPDHLLWIGTENGLAVMNPEEGGVKTYGMMDGLCSNVVFTITPGQPGHLWLATNNGISDFDTRTFKFKNYYIPMGLPNNRIDGAACFTSGSQLYFSTGSYLIHCDPKKLESHGLPPPIVITGIRVFDRPISIFNNGSQLEPIRLNYRQNMVSFEFTSINFNNPESNQYTYRLYGFDGDWMNGGARQMVSYTNLPGGTYQFVVRSLHHDGSWHEAEPVYLSIAPPFWKQWWFIGLVFVSIGLVVYFFFQFRVNQLLRLQKIRLNIARDLHDDIGSTLSSIHMVSSMAEQKPITQISTSLFKSISQASRQALELMNEIVWSINPKNDTMEMILIHMRQFTSELLEPANINFNFSTSGDMDHLIIPLEKRKDFYLIFKEAINNLAKYSHATRAGVDLIAKPKLLQLEISDNGCGFDPGQPAGGNGLKNMKSRAASIGATLQVNTAPGKGTRIELILPLVP